MTDKVTKLVTVKYFDNIAALVLASQTNCIPITYDKRRNILKSVLWISVYFSKYICVTNAQGLYPRIRGREIQE